MITLNAYDGERAMLDNGGIELFSEYTPPILERLFGYRSSERWVAFFWGGLVNHHAVGYCFDGKVFSPLNPLAWDTFFSHPLIVSMNYCRIKGRTVKRFDFGDSLHTSTDCLLLDRLERRLHAAEKQCAIKHLKAEIQSAKNANTDSDPFLQPVSSNTKGKIASASTGSLEMIAEMTAWLDDRMALLKKTGLWPKLI